MGENKVEANSVIEAMIHDQDRRSTTSHPVRPALTEADGEIEFAKFTRSLGIEPEDW